MDMIILAVDDNNEIVKAGVHGSIDGLPGSVVILRKSFGSGLGSGARVNGGQFDGYWANVADVFPTVMHNEASDEDVAAVLGALSGVKLR
jgi:hypothetical protein